MRRKSERNKSKSSVEKKPVEPSPRKSRRTSRRRKRSTSHSSSDDSDDVPLKTTVAVVEKHETVVCTPVDEPKKSTSHSASDEDKQEQPIWKVKTSEAPSGEIQKLKICLQRPPTTPERTEKSPRRRRGKASSQSDDASLTPDEKTPVSAGSGGRRRLRRDSPAITPPVTAADAAIAKDECMIVVTEPSLGKGKFECSQTTAGRTEGSRTTVLPSAGDESLKQCEIKQDDSIATTRVDAQPPQQEQTVQLQPKPAADRIDTDKIDVTSVASAPEQQEPPVAVAVEQHEEEEDSNRVIKDTSTSSSTLDSSKVEVKKVDSLQQSTEVSSLNAREIIKQQSKEEATSEQINEATSEKITKAAVEEINKPAVKDISEEAAQKITKASSQKLTGPVLKEITETAVKEISEEALKNTTVAVVKESPEVCSKQSTISPTAASEPAAQQTSKASVKKSSEVVKEPSDAMISEATKETPEVCSKQSAISLAASEVAAQETSTATSQETSAAASHQISEPTVKQSDEEVGKKTSEAVVKQTSAVCSQQSAISLTARELSLEETNATASQKISKATQPIKDAASTEANEATSQQTKKIVSQETKEAASQETKQATSQETIEASRQATKDVAVEETEEAVVQKTKAVAVQETKETTRQETSEAAEQQTKEASKQETKEAAVQKTKEAVVQETNEAASQKTKKAASQETKEATRQATNETSVPESSEASAGETNVAVSDQPTTVTPSETSEVSSQKTNDTVSSDVTSHDSEVVCTQSTEVTAETKVASPDTTEASNNEVSSSDGSAKDNVQTTADTSKVTSISGEKCTVVPKETSEAECTRVESNSEVVSEPEMPQTSEHKPTKQESNIVQKDSIKVSEAHSESAETKTVTEVPDKSDSKDRIGSPKPEKTNLVEGEKMVDSSKQSSETLTKKESSDSETVPVKTANITEDLTSIVRTEVLTNRKRKWGKYQALLLPDEHITMEKISKLYPGMKILSEDELRMDAEDTVREKPPRKEREVTVTAPIPPPLAVKDEDVEKDVSNIGLNRKISIVNDEASKLQPPPSPSKNAVSAVLYITNLVRPFTLKQLKELLSRTGTILDDGFWTDRIKSKCYVQYENADEAEATRNALHGVQWPIGNGKKLMIDFGTQEAMEAARSATTEAPAPAVVAKPAVEKLIEKVPPTHIGKKEPQVEESRWEKTKTAPVREWDVGKVPQDQHDRSRSRDRPVSRNDRSEKRRHSRNESPPNGDHVTARKKKKDEPTEVKLMDDLFHKTKATPSIYWLPLTPEQIAKKQQQRLQRMAEHKRRMEESRRGERDFGRGGARARRRSARHDAD